MGGVLTGTLSGGGAMTGSMAAGMVANKKPGTYTVTPETLAKILKMAEPGATIKLSPGEYGRIDLHGQNAYPEDCTFIGCEGATVDGVSITSGVLSSDIIKEGSSDITNAILPSGLTFISVTFSNAFSLRNARVDNLTIKDCTFESCNIYITPECFSDSYGNDLGSGNTSSYRYPHAHLKQKNLIISNCIFNNAEGYQNAVKTSVASGIHVIGVENVTVSGNTITGALDAQGAAKIYDGIQVGGYQTSPFYVYSYGDTKVTMNTITNCNSRGINVHSINTGNVTVASNKLFNTDNQRDETIIVRNSENVTVNWTINGVVENTWDGRKIVVGDGITVSNLTSPFDNLLNGVATTEEYRCTANTEAELEVWLEDVFNQMEDYSFRNIYIHCEEISDFALMGTIHKRQHYATVDLTSHINGHHYMKIRNPKKVEIDGETTTVNWVPFNKKSIEQQICEKASNNLLNGVATTEEYRCTANTEAELEVWLEDVFNQMEDYSFRNIYIECEEISDFAFMGTIHKRQHYATVDLTSHINGHHYIKIRNPRKVEVGGAITTVNWKPFNKKSIENQKLDKVPTVYWSDGVYDSGDMLTGKFTTDGTAYLRFFLVEVSAFAIHHGGGGRDTFIVDPHTIPVEGSREFARDSCHLDLQEQYTYTLTVSNSGAGNYTFTTGGNGDCKITRIVGYA